MTDTERERLLAELVKWGESLPLRQPGDITTQDYAASAGVCVNTAESRLKRWVSQGLLETLLVYDPDSSRSRRVYRKK